MYNERTPSLKGNTILVGGVELQVKRIGIEPSDPKYGYKVAVYEVIGEEGKSIDAAIVRVWPRKTTPPQLVVRDNPVIDIPMHGKGTLFKVDNNGVLTFNSTQKPMFHEKGSYIFWYAGVYEFTFLELCLDKKYELGDFKNVDINSDEVPKIFRDTFKAFSRS